MTHLCYIHTKKIILTYFMKTIFYKLRKILYDYIIVFNIKIKSIKDFGLGISNCLTLHFLISIK